MLLRQPGPFGLLIVLAGCAGTQAPPSSIAADGAQRSATSGGALPGGGLHVWSTLTPPEGAAMEGIGRAKLGDAHALLALAIVASAEGRDAASYARFQGRVDQFVAELKGPMAAATDDWHRGYELNRAMHRVFFGGERAELGSYELDQRRITSIFTRGRYNCISSAMLFIVLARGFGLPVRASRVPSHVFVEMGTRGGKIIEIETTSSTGFDWVHDEQFYGEAATKWALSRGLQPVTSEQYKQREILEPYQLMAAAMRNSLPGETAQDRFRLNELAALVDANGENEEARIQTYISESFKLYQAKDWATMRKFLDVVEPAVSAIGARSRNTNTLELVSWLHWYQASALIEVGPADRATAIVRDGLKQLDAGWKDAGSLQENYIGLLVDRMQRLYAAKEYRPMIEAFDVVGPVLVDVGAKTRAPKTLQLLSWLRWEHAWALMQAGRLEQAMTIVRDGLNHLDASWPDAANLKDSYLGLLSQRLYALYTNKDYRAIVTTFSKYRDVCQADKGCLDNVGAAYASLSIDPINAGNWQAARQVLQECLAALPGELRCADALKELESRHRF